ETVEDLDRHECTNEEREEYEAHIEAGHLVFAGVDYEQILRAAEKEADVVIWDGGNNDTSFYKSDLHIVVADPHRPGHEVRYYPGETNLRMAKVVIVNKVNTATKEGIEEVEANIRELNPGARIIRADSEVTVEDPEAVAGKKVLVVEDGPTLTHGEMSYGAGHVAARRYNAGEIVDPRPYAVGSIKGAYELYPHMTDILPALGYGDTQVKELQETVNAVPCDLILVGTPFNLSRVIETDKPMMRVSYALDAEVVEELAKLVDELLARKAKETQA
ncbi:MAG: GTPase, partial [Myxococcota bacterium]